MGFGCDPDSRLERAIYWPYLIKASLVKGWSLSRRLLCERPLVRGATKRSDDQSEHGLFIYIYCYDDLDTTWS